MNIFKKIYCRVFQTAFRLALPVLPYRKPQIVGSVRELPDVIRGNHYSCVLIVTDSSIRSLGLTKRLEHTLERAAIPFAKNFRCSLPFQRPPEPEVRQPSPLSSPMPKHGTNMQSTTFH